MVAFDGAGGWEYRTEEVAEGPEAAGQVVISRAVDGLVAEAALDGWQLAFAARFDGAAWKVLLKRPKGPRPPG